jgi:hypothetical protein
MTAKRDPRIDPQFGDVIRMDIGPGESVWDRTVIARRGNLVEFVARLGSQYFDFMETIDEWQEATSRKVVKHISGGAA